MKQHNTLAIIAFWALGVIWGSNFIYMKLAADLISPMQIVFLRVLFGLLPVLVLALLTQKLQMAHLKHLPHFIVMSLLATVVYYFGFAKGTSLLLSGLAGILSGAIPLFSFVLAVIFIAEEKATALKIGGALLGLLGVVLIGLPSNNSGLSANVEGVFYMILGALSIGASFVYAKRFIVPLQLPAVALTTYQLGAGVLILLIMTDLNGLTAIADDTHALLGLIVGLGLLGTGLAYIIYYYIVDKMGAISASSVTYIPPVVALFIGAVFVGEPIRLSDYFATLCIFAGVFLLNKEKK